VDEIAAGRERLGDVERELARLNAQYELAMSAFKFGEADALQRRIAALDGERRSLAARLPALPAPAEPPTGLVPVIDRPRRRLRRPRRR
jgi:hypothetical protein